MMREFAATMAHSGYGIASLLLAISIFGIVLLRLSSFKKEQTDTWSRLPLEDPAEQEAAKVPPASRA